MTEENMNKKITPGIDFDELDELKKKQAQEIGLGDSLAEKNKREEITEKPSAKVTKSLPKQTYKLVVRTVGMGTDPTRGIFDVAQTDAYINQLIADGWNVEQTMFMGTGPVDSTWIFGWALMRQ